MQKINQTILYFAQEILKFLEYEHHAILDLTDPQASLPRSASNEELRLIKSSGRPMNVCTPTS